MGKRYTVAVDFDGVIHSYTSPWVAPEIIPDPPVSGAIDWLNEIARDFDVVIHTTRGKTADGRFAVLAYLTEYGFDVVGYLADRAWTAANLVTWEKVAALVYIDDRGYRFDGTNFPTADAIHRLRPWNKP